MHIYLCSTLRHLLFSLLKAFSAPQQKSHIFMILDQQNIDKNNFNPRCLPANIEVHFIQRQHIRTTLYRGVTGNAIKLMAERNLKTSASLRRYIHRCLFIDTLKVNIPFADTNDLFLYNDRNKISRLFRLAFKDYSIIEEGVANYREIKLKKIEKIIAALTKSKRDKRYFGDDKRCKHIYLLHAEKGPSALQHKIKQIDFIDDKVITEYGYQFFNYHATHNYSFIIATQPHVIEQVDFLVYQKLSNALTTRGIPFAFKIHPREDPDCYLKLFPDVARIESKIPLELIIFGAQDKCRILSICTSAGTGFEKFCTRLNLIKDNELEELYEIYDAWHKDNQLIDKRIISVFAEDPELSN